VSDYPDPAARFASEPLDARRRTAVVFCGMGGPDGPDSVAPFLRNLFLDPEVLSLPRPIAWALGALIVCLRREAVKARYREIECGGGSPQLGWTRRQVDAVVERLERRGVRAIAGVAMSYWHPFAAETAESLAEQGAEQLVLVPTFPQYSNATSATILHTMREAWRARAPQRPVAVLWAWHLLPGYLEALAVPIIEVVRGWTEIDPSTVGVVLAAHSLPRRVVERGDPYVAQTWETATEVHARVKDALSDHTEWFAGVAGGDEPVVGFQSRVGPVKWVGPDLVTVCLDLVRGGVTHLMIQPVSFTCEHIETLHELDIELREMLQVAGAEEVRRGAALNMDSGWIQSLTDAVERQIRGAS